MVTVQLNFPILSFPTSSQHIPYLTRGDACSMVKQFFKNALFLGTWQIINLRKWKGWHWTSYEVSSSSSSQKWRKLGSSHVFSYLSHGYRDSESYLHDNQWNKRCNLSSGISEDCFWQYEQYAVYKFRPTTKWLVCICGWAKHHLFLHKQLYPWILLWKIKWIWWP